jgi:hypothetical protein
LIIFRSNLRQHRGQYLQSEGFLIPQAIGAALHDSDLVVEPLDEAERYLVFGLAVGGDAIPVPLDHLGELLVRLQALPLEARSPVLEELFRPGPAVGAVRRLLLQRALGIVPSALITGFPSHLREPIFRNIGSRHPVFYIVGKNTTVFLDRQIYLRIPNLDVFARFLPGFCPKDVPRFQLGNVGGHAQGGGPTAIGLQAWQCREAFEYVESLAGPLLAWEYLRRNPSYRAAWHLRDLSVAETAGHDWGLLRLIDPDLDARAVNPIWQPDPPTTMRVIRSSSATEGFTLYDLDIDWSAPGAVHDDGGTYLTAVVGQNAWQVHVAEDLGPQVDRP